MTRACISGHRPEGHHVVLSLPAGMAVFKQTLTQIGAVNKDKQGEYEAKVGPEAGLHSRTQRGGPKRQPLDSSRRARALA